MATKRRMPKRNEAHPERLKTKKNRHAEEPEKEECKHPTLYGGLCVVCGQNVGNLTASAATPHQTLVVGDGKQLQVSQETSQLNSAQYMERLRSKRMLALVLDIDHTIHGTGDDRNLPFDAAESPTGISDLRIHSSTARYQGDLVNAVGPTYNLGASELNVHRSRHRV